MKNKKQNKVGKQKEVAMLEEPVEQPEQEVLQIDLDRLNELLELEDMFVRVREAFPDKRLNIGVRMSKTGDMEIKGVEVDEHYTLE